MVELLAIENIDSVIVYVVYKKIIENIYKGLFLIVKYIITVCTNIIKKDPNRAQYLNLY